MSVSDEDRMLFSQACRRIVNRERLREGIGTLQEKTVHAVLKTFYEPDSAYQEIPVGNFVADILRDGEIMEIQTRNFDKLRRKLESFLPLCPVTVIYPIPYHKTLYWIDEQSGEIGGGRRSPKKGSIYDAIRELYKIKQYLDHPDLQICLVLLDMDEYKLLNGWSHDRKRGSTRYDRIPTALEDEFVIGSLSDYTMFLPDSLPDSFTSRDLAQAAHVRLPVAQQTLTILSYLKVVTCIGRQSRLKLYKVSRQDK